LGGKGREPGRRKMRANGGSPLYGKKAENFWRNGTNQNQGWPVTCKKILTKKKPRRQYEIKSAFESPMSRKIWRLWKSKDYEKKLT